MTVVIRYAQQDLQISCQIGQFACASQECSHTRASPATKKNHHVIGIPVLWRLQSLTSTPSSRVQCAARKHKTFFASVQRIEAHHRIVRMLQRLPSQKERSASRRSVRIDYQYSGAPDHSCRLKKERSAVSTGVFA